MQLSTFSFILGIVELLIGLPMLVRPGPTSQWIVKVKGDDVLLRVVGVVFLVMACLVLIEDPSVRWSTAGFVRLMAWLTAAKSIVFCWWPSWHARLSERFLAHPTGQRITGVLIVGWGIAFVFAGYHLR